MSKVKKINNPFVQQKGDQYMCFGCSPNNMIGFNLEFFAEDEIVFAKWKPEQKYEGYLNVVHGGIQATLMDEIASWYIYSMLDTAGVTQKLEVQYHKPLYVSGGEVLIKADLEKQTKKLARIKTEIINSNGQVSSSAIVEYYLFPPNVARVKYKYPGKEAFWL
ncbi:PaaI family thioesterase [Carboxylicivirga sp. A043]|uniref:PaaI family thioesterase n=1 Tax=Carboxylicivirga litoralis TaxID=2816963 RepID=UPI0021CB816C|nr:PaaI family thioesterase [Carboxylicivirga sp. A043]MCU4155739.1 PaaI family thioesterase [Carboxylicivirga sp. A043]